MTMHALLHTALQQSSDVHPQFQEPQVFQISGRRGRKIGAFCGRAFKRLNNHYCRQTRLTIAGEHPEPFSRSTRLTSLLRQHQAEEGT
jgi:hypothetical protein